jgi:hypothetical protein
LFRRRRDSNHKSGIHPNTNKITITDIASTGIKAKFHNIHIKNARHQSKNSHPPVKSGSSFIFGLPEEDEI